VSQTVANGSVDFDPFSAEFFNGAYDTYRRLRNEAPVYYSAQWDFWALSRYEDVAPATKDHDTYSSPRAPPSTWSRRTTTPFRCRR
jgi:cytochrome P450